MAGIFGSTLEKGSKYLAAERLYSNGVQERMNEPGGLLCTQCAHKDLGRQKIFRCHSV
jgi:hypothetical protein